MTRQKYNVLRTNIHDFEPKTIQMKALTRSFTVLLNVDDALPAHLRATVCERSRDENSIETLEAVRACSRVVPVVRAEVVVMSRDTAAVSNDAVDDETNTGKTLEGGEDEVDLAVAPHAEALNGLSDDEENRDPYADVIARSVPDRQTCS